MKNYHKYFCFIRLYELQKEKYQINFHSLGTKSNNKKM